MLQQQIQNLFWAAMTFFQSLQTIQTAHFSFVLLQQGIISGGENHQN
jgi:hypothetical protein